MTARLSEAHVRQTIAERELQTWLVVDRSARLAFGTALTTKRQLVLAATAAVGFLTNRDGNRLGAVFAGPVDGGELPMLPPRGSRKHFLRLLHDISAHVAIDGAGVTDLDAALVRVGAVARRRGLVTVISDFLVAPGWELSLRMLAQRHDVLAIQVTDPRESSLPDVGLITVRDPATGALREVATSKRKVREAFAEASATRQQELVAELRAARVDHLVLSTDRPWLDDLVPFVAARRARLARRSSER